MSRANPTTNRVRVLIVDDHPMTCAGLVHVINHEPDLALCAEAENAANALDTVYAFEPDLVLASMARDGQNALTLAYLRGVAQTNRVAFFGHTFPLDKN